MSIQYCPPGQHRSLKAERVIRTFKNYFISTLCTVSNDFSMTLWDKLLPQAELCLNHLLSYNPNPSIAAYEGLHGCQFDFCAHPITPAGATVIFHDKPTGRSSWTRHGLLGFYLGPAKNYYRCFNVWLVDTQTVHVTDTLAWLFDKLSLPTIGPHDIALAAIKDLTEAINSLAKAHPSTAHLRRLSDPPTTILSDLTAFVKLFYPGNTSSATPTPTVNLQNSSLSSCNQPHQIEPAPIRTEGGRTEHRIIRLRPTVRPLNTSRCTRRPVTP